MPLHPIGVSLLLGLLLGLLPMVGTEAERGAQQPHDPPASTESPPTSPGSNCSDLTVKLEFSTRVVEHGEGTRVMSLVCSLNGVWVFGCLGLSCSVGFNSISRWRRGSHTMFVWAISVGLNMPSVVLSGGIGIAGIVLSDIISLVHVTCFSAPPAYPLVSNIKAGRMYCCLCI